MITKTILINRAAVLTLWATVVARRLGFRKEEALTLGKAVAGLNAQSKGRRLGIYKPLEEKPEKARKKKQGKRFRIEVCGRAVPVRNTDQGIRALQGQKTINPDSVQNYLERKFNQEFDEAKRVMEKLAKAYQPKELAEEAYHLYERFRPDIPEGKKGWGAKGHLDLDQMERLAENL